jgi:hypothetical protein
VAGGAWLNQSWTASNNGSDIWLQKCFTFTAQGTSAELRFTSLAGTVAGMLLDDITMWETPKDTEAPMIGNVPTPLLYVECSDPLPPPADLMATDNCAAAVTTVLTETQTPQSCHYDLQRTWVVTDGCNNSTTVTQLIKVRDTQPPEFSIVPYDTIVPCGSNYNLAFNAWLNRHAGGKATDNCDPGFKWTTTYAQQPSGYCKSIPVTFTVKDNCGNVNTAVANFIIEDNTPPNLLQEAQDLTLVCDVGAIAKLHIWLNQHGGAIATDACGPLVWTDDYSAGSTGNSIPVTFTATDQCQNSISSTALFNQPPMIDTVLNNGTTCDPTKVKSDTTIKTQGVCKTITINKITLLPSDTIILKLNVCDPAMAGNDTFHLSNKYGCDSLVIQKKILVPGDTVHLQSTTCDVTQAGTFTQMLSNQHGCDSMVIQTVILLPGDTVHLQATTCDVNQAGVFTQMLSNQHGCDSMVIRTVTLLASDTIHLSGTSCNAAQTGVFTQNLINQHGCDSIIIKTVTIVPGDTTHITATSCNTAQTGVFYQNLLNKHGCDSVIVKTVSLLPSDTIHQKASTCNAALAGVFTQKLANHFGCDSIIIRTVALLPSDTTHLIATTCNIAQAGIFTQKLVNHFGCDSIVVKTVTLLPKDTIHLNATTCNTMQTGVFTQKLVNHFGCDSIVIKTVTLLPTDTTHLTAATCDVTQTGIFTQKLTNHYGCDSIVLKAVTLLPSNIVTLYSGNCDPAAGGMFTQHLQNHYGCDSTVITLVTVWPTDTTHLFGTSCHQSNVGVFTKKLINHYGCDSTVVLSVSYALSDTVNISKNTCNPQAAGTFTKNLLSYDGCDSVVITTIHLQPANTIALQTSTCDPAAAGVFVQHLTNHYGCDSTVTTTVTLLPKSTTSLSVTTCDPAAAGVFVQHLTNYFGCDSTITTTVTLLPASTSSLSVTTCDPAAAGVFVQHLTNHFGCDSTVIATVSLLPSTAVALAATTCDPSAAGVFTQILQNHYGCDSVITRTVTLLPSDATLKTIHSCDPSQVGTSVAHLTNHYGCDSTVTTQTVLDPLPTIVLDVSDFNGFAVSCPGSKDGSITATATGTNPFSYAWSAGSGSPQQNTMLGPGNYTVTVTDGNGCTVAGTAELQEPPSIKTAFVVSPPDCFKKHNGKVTCNASGGVLPYLYAINGGSFQTSNVFDGLDAGAYHLTVQDANSCEHTDILAIQAPVPLNVHLGQDLDIQFGDHVTLEAQVNVPFDSLASVVWSVPDSACPQCPTLSVIPYITTAYSISVTDGNGCKASDTLTVIVNRRKDIYVPNVFSPGVDGKNALFMVYAKPFVIAHIKTFAIFDRWGNAIFKRSGFSPNDPVFGWDGTYQSKPLSPGVFVWYGEFEFVDGTTEIYSGDVAIVR